MRTSSFTLFTPVTLLSLACATPGAPPSEDAISLVDACAELSQCVDFRREFGGEDGVSACVATALRMPSEGALLPACVLAARSCEEAARTCLGAGVLPEPCDPFTERSGCTENAVLVCAHGIRQRHDCSEHGLSCVEDTAGQVFCGEASECERSRCESGRLILCSNGRARPFECDGPCVETEVGAVCGGEGEACEGRVFECDGDVAVTCRGGFLHREVCGPGLCSTDDGAFCRSAPVCFEGSSCDGSAIVTCADKAVVRSDCAAFGGTCAEIEGGGVRCVPEE